jgi:hypothetical protein
MFTKDMTRNKCFSSRFGYHMFYDLYQFVSYLLTLLRTRAAIPPTLPHVFTECCFIKDREMNE